MQKYCMIVRFCQHPLFRDHTLIISDLLIYNLKTTFQKVQNYKTVLIPDQTVKIQEVYSQGFITKLVCESLYLSKTLLGRTNSIHSSTNCCNCSWGLLLVKYSKIYFGNSSFFCKKCINIKSIRSHRNRLVMAVIPTLCRDTHPKFSKILSQSTLQ